MDSNLLGTADSSDPYCQVHVNGKQIGWTPTQFKTLNPIFGGPDSTFRIDKCGGGTKITIKIYDYDNLKSDDHMGTVEFYVRDLLFERQHKDQYPNFWASVMPPKGYENVPAGRLEVRLLQVNESEESVDKLAKPVSLSDKYSTAISIKPGPRAGNIPSSLLKETIMSAKTPVILHVYDVGRDNSKVRNINNTLPYCGVGGIFHGALEIYGREYSFGGSRQNVCGIFSGKPAGCPMHTYRESIYLGDADLNRKQVVAVLRRMKPEWMAPTYDLLRKNCCHYCNELAIELGVGGIPEWVMSLANIASGINQMMGKDVGTTEDMNDLHELRKTWKSIEVKENRHNLFEDLTLEYVMAVRLQRTFRAKRAKKNAAKGDPTEYAGPVHVLRASINEYSGQGFETSQTRIRRTSATAGSTGDESGFEVGA